jgi:hypothetical protein
MRNRGRPPPGRGGSRRHRRILDFLAEGGGHAQISAGSSSVRVSSPSMYRGRGRQKLECAFGLGGVRDR